MASIARRALNLSRKGGTIYVPGLMIPVGPRVKHRMRDMSMVDLTLWGKVDQRAKAGAVKIIEACNENDGYRNERIRALAENPDLKLLHDAELHVFGYEPKEGDDQVDLYAPDEGGGNSRVHRGSSHHLLCPRPIG
jgi:hypothetical protein